jgi:hypothetical protein
MTFALTEADAWLIAGAAGLLFIAISEISQRRHAGRRPGPNERRK